MDFDHVDALEELCVDLWTELTQSLDLNVKAGAMTSSDARRLGKHYMKELAVLYVDDARTCLRLALDAKRNTYPQTVDVMARIRLSQDALSKEELPACSCTVCGAPINWRAIARRDYQHAAYKWVASGACAQCQARPDTA